MNFLRRRKPSISREDRVDLFASDSVEPSGTSFRTTERKDSMEALNPFADVARRRSARLRRKSKTPSLAPTTELKIDREKAESIDRSMHSKWFGEDRSNQDPELVPVTSTGSKVLNWLDKQPTLRSPRSSEPDTHQASPVQDSAQIDAVDNKPKPMGLKWSVYSVIVLLCLLSVPLEVGLVAISSGYLSFSSKGVPATHQTHSLPFREKFFHVLLFEDVHQRFHEDFAQGMHDASISLRVNVSISRTEDLPSAIHDVDESRDALYDGRIISTSNDKAYSTAVNKGGDNNAVMMVGALESYTTMSTKYLGHVGDSETEVGKLTGKALRKAGKQTALCLCHKDDVDSVHRCRGFSESFGKQTYELNLKTTMQSELKSKLIPIILDDSEIDALFVSDTRSFPVVHQIMKSLNRLCLNRKPTHNRRCVYLAAYGTDIKILKAMTKRELQLIVDPQEYLRGYLATALISLNSIGYVLPANPATSMLISRVVTTPVEAKRLLAIRSCGKRDGHLHRLKFKFYLIGKKPKETVEQLKAGLRLASRDLGVYVQLHHVPPQIEQPLSRELLEADGVAVSIGSREDVSKLGGFDAFTNTGKTMLSFGLYHPEVYTADPSLLHVGYTHEEESQAFKSIVLKPPLREKRDLHPRFLLAENPRDFDENASLQGYLSVLFLVINSTCGQMPSGLFSTGIYKLL